MNTAGEPPKAQHERIAEHFAAIADLPDDQAATRLNTLRRTDPDIAAEVETLLRFDARSSILDRPPETTLTTPNNPDTKTAGEQPSSPAHEHPHPSNANNTNHTDRRIGPFRLLEPVGKGGMGVVYRAQQNAPDRTVALKLVRSSLLMPNAARSLETEANLLARMTHPGIARIYEAGSLHDGDAELSYFAMELVEGQTLTQHAQSHSLSITERAALLAKICDAVHHAHQRGVIHRDLKPANIIIDKDNAPRVLDFGIARLIEPGVQVETARHGDTPLIGTLAYMSPEQLAGKPDAEDTRTDIYALGVILYQLLTGRTPVVVEGLTLTKAIDALRTGRHKKPRSINPRITRDLELVTMKAIQHDPDRRYASAAAFAADLRRVLNQRPVEARPATTAYKLRRFSQRNPALCAAIAIATAAAITGIAGIAWGYAESIRRVQSLQTANTEIAEQASRADAVNEFLRRMLVSADPLGETGTGRADMTVVEMLDRESGQIDAAFTELPASEALIRSTIGNVYMSLGRFDAAEPHLRQSIQLHTDAWGPDAPETDRARRDLAVLLSQTSRTSEAIAIFEQLTQRQINEKRDNDLEHALTASRFGGVLLEQGDFTEAERWLTRAAEILENTGTDRTDLLPSLLNNIARARSGQGDPDGAEDMYAKARDAFERLHGQNHPTVAIAEQNIATLRYARGDYQGAAASFKRTIDALTPLMGETHPTIATIRHNLAYALYELGRYEESLDQLTSAANAYVEAYGDDHPETLSTRMGVADTLLKLERFEDAADQFADIAQRWQAINPDDPRPQRAAFLHGFTLAKLGQSDRGETLMHVARRRFIERDSVASPTGQRLTRMLASHLLDQGRTEAAQTLATELDPNTQANRPLLDRLSSP